MRFSCYVLLCEQKTRAKNVGEINTRYQFYQHFTHAFFEQKSLSSYFLLTFWFQIFGTNFLYKKCAGKMSMKLTTGINFTNIL